MGNRNRRQQKGDRPKTEEELITDLAGNLNRAGISEDIDNGFHLRLR